MACRKTLRRITKQADRIAFERTCASAAVFGVKLVLGEFAIISVALFVVYITLYEGSRWIGQSAAEWVALPSVAAAMVACNFFGWKLLLKIVKK